jgi:hypothetical protein
VGDSRLCAMPILLLLGLTICLLDNRSDRKEDKEEGDTMNKVLEGILLLILTLAWCIIIIGIGLSVLNNIEMSQTSITYDVCCFHRPCTDTYYSLFDNKCHLTLCENEWGKKNNCTYDPNWCGQEVVTAGSNPFIS